MRSEEKGERTEDWEKRGLRIKKKTGEWGVKKIGLFGSILNGKQTKKSDIDILIKFDNISFDNYAEIIILLENIFKRKVDLVTESSLRPEMAYVKKEAEYAKI